MNTALAKIQQDYQDCNLLMPVASEVQLNPFYKYTVMEVKADLSDNSGDVFKVGSVKTGHDPKTNKDIYADTFAPSKPLLMKLAAAAGIQFDPNNTGGIMVNKNCYKGKAFGAMRMPDGTGRTHMDEKVINLDDEEDRLRLEFMDKSIEGIADEKAAQEAAKMFKGEWFDTVNKWGKSVKGYKIADEDRQKYIERSLLVNMTILRKTASEKALTGAILRVVRALIGMKGQYTKEELSKPFAIPRVTFSPDYSDPQVRSAMLEQGMNAVNNMFGTSRQLAAAPMAETTPLIDSFNPEEFADNPAFASTTEPVPDNFEDDPFAAAADKNPLPWEAEADAEETAQEEPDVNVPHTCSKCNKDITEKVAEYSVNQFGAPLCMGCQKGAKRL